MGLWYLRLLPPVGWLLADASAIVVTVQLYCSGELFCICTVLADLEPNSSSHFLGVSTLLVADMLDSHSISEGILGSLGEWILKTIDGIPVFFFFFFSRKNCRSLATFDRALRNGPRA